MQAETGSRGFSSLRPFDIAHREACRRELPVMKTTNWLALRETRSKAGSLYFSFHLRTAGHVSTRSTTAIGIRPEGVHRYPAEKNRRCEARHPWRVFQDAG
jgi:hypothetical protein